MKEERAARYGAGEQKNEGARCRLNAALHSLISNTFRARRETAAAPRERCKKRPAAARHIITLSSDERDKSSWLVVRGRLLDCLHPLCGIKHTDGAGQDRQGGR